MADEIFVDETVIELACGDLTAWRGDAVVNPANTSLVMGGGVAGALHRKAGDTVQREALEKAPLGLGEVARTRAGLLPAKFVIHAAVMGDDRITNPEIIGRATAAALADAESVGLKSIAFPALGTGVGGLPYEEAAAAMFEAAVTYLRRRAAPRLQRVVFMLYDEAALETFRVVLQTFRGNH